jgi:hypothetical protein
VVQAMLGAARLAQSYQQDYASFNRRLYDLVGRIQSMHNTGRYSSYESADIASDRLYSQLQSVFEDVQGKVVSVSTNRSNLR